MQALPVKSAAAAAADRGWSIRTYPAAATAAPPAQQAAATPAGEPTTAAAPAGPCTCPPATSAECSIIVIPWVTDCTLEVNAEEVRGWAGYMRVVLPLPCCLHPQPVSLPAATH